MEPVGWYFWGYFKVPYYLQFKYKGRQQADNKLHKREAAEQKANLSAADQSSADTNIE